MAFQFLYMALAVDKLNLHDLSNNACHECLPKKTKITWYYVAAELPGSSNKSEYFSYKGKWVNL